VFFPLSPWLAAAFAVAPAIFAWWTGRAVLARADDPVLPELLFERRRRLAGLGLVGTFALTLLFADEALWALPLLWVALLLSSYPLRRALFGERWNILAFLRYTIFSTIGQLGLWLLVGAGPALAVSFALGLAPNDHAAAVRIAALAGVGIAVIITLWQFQYVRVFLDLHRAVPLREVARPELMTRLDEILERAGPALKRRPEVYRYGAPGAYVMNAFALPSRVRPAIALGTSLVASFDDEEIAAVFAHEVAHHEQFQSSPMWRRGRWTWLILVVLIAALPPLLVDGVPSAALIISWCLPAVILTMLGRGIAKRRAAETASDLRAVALTGNADALAGALTKLHVYSRVPRRWPHAIEDAATHPSLARRIQALRAESGSVAAPRTTSAFTGLRSPRAGDALGFDLERAYWFEGVPPDATLDLHALREAASSYRAIAYGELSELRVAIAGDSRSLRATDRDGRSWSVPLAPEDVAVVQQMLDRVDFKLGRQRSAPVAANSTATRWLALGLLVMLTAVGQLGFAFIPIVVVLVRPTIGAAVAAVAGITLARIGLSLRGLSFADPVRQIALLIALVIAAILGVQALKRARAEASRGNEQRLTREMGLVAGILLVVAILFAAALWPFLTGRPAALFDHPLAVGIATALSGAGAALLTGPSRWWRGGGSITSVLALLSTIVLTGDGWLFNRLPGVAWSTKRLAPAGEVRLTGTATNLVASPGGRAFAVTEYLPSRRATSADVSRYVIGRFTDSGRVVRTSDAERILFLDDEAFIALGEHGDRLEIRAERIAPDSSGNVIVLWRQALPDMNDPQLVLDRGGRRWLVIARTGDWRFVLASDTLGGAAPRVTEVGRRSPNDVGERMTQPLVAFANGDVLWSTLPEVRGLGSGFAPLLLTYLTALRWEIHGADATGERVLADVRGLPSCASELDASGALCVERSSNAAHLWRARSARDLRRIADLPPTYDVLHIDASDRITLAERSGARIALLDVEARRGARLTLPDSAGGRWLGDATAAGAYVFSLSVGRDGTKLKRFLVR
jgi:Zn-dependent protease with chaperone function